MLHLHESKYSHTKVKSEEIFRELNWIVDNIISEFYYRKTFKVMICIKPLAPWFRINIRTCGNIKGYIVSFWQ